MNIARAFSELNLHKHQILKWLTGVAKLDIILIAFFIIFGSMLTIGFKFYADTLGAWFSPATLTGSIIDVSVFLIMFFSFGFLTDYLINRTLTFTKNHKNKKFRF